MKTLICYKTKHGATKKYMDWLADAVGADIKAFDEIPRSYHFDGYDTVVISSGTYAGFMPLKRFLKRNFKVLQKKRLIVVAVGAAPADDPWSIRSYNKIPENIRSHIAYFKIMGDMIKSSRPADYVSPVKKDNLKQIIKAIEEAKK